MQQPLLSASVLRDDGIRGTIVGTDTSGALMVKFDDGTSSSIAPDTLVRQADGTYRVKKSARGGGHELDEIVIPVVAEELTVEKEQVVRGKVHMHKRVETREEVVSTPTFREEVNVAHIPINRFIEDIVPEVREEDGVLVIPVVEEVVVTSKRLLLREEVHVRRARTETTDRQTVRLRREVVDVEREEPGDRGQRERKP